MINQKKGVLIITSHFPPNMGGVESHLQELVVSLTKRKWLVCIATYQPLAAKKTAPFLEKNRRLVIFRMPWIGFNIVHKLTHYPALEFLYLFPGLFLISLIALIKYRDKISVIHCQGLVPTAVGVLLKKIINIKLISSTHNLYFFPSSGLYRFFAKLIFSNVDMVLTPTDFSANEIKSLGVKESKVSRFRYWIDLNRFKVIRKDLAKKQLNLKDFCVLFVGRLIPTKGIDLILKSLKGLDPDIEVVIAGDGPSRGKIEQYQSKFSNLKYIGRIENSKLSNFYSGADLVIVPSIVDEGFGFVVMESAACGTPVLATNKGGLSEAVSPQIGRLILPNAKSLSDGINNFYKDKKLLMKLTGGCREYAKKHFSEDNVEDIIKQYEK